MYGVYSYAVMSWNSAEFRREFKAFKMRVEVLEEEGNRYHIRYKEHHARTQSINTTHWVRKDKVKIDEAPAAPHQYELRLPYKDE